MTAQSRSLPDALASRMSSTFKQAVSLGIEAVVRHHLRNGSDVNCHDDKGQTPLIIAAAKGHAKICAILLEAGADPSLKDLSGCTAIDAAIGNKRGNVWELLQRLPADVPVRKPNQADTVPSPPASAPLATMAPAPVPVPPVSAQSVPAVIIGDEICDFDLSAWQSETEFPPPPQDMTVLPQIEALQKDIGGHVPIDLDEDWSDIDISLPELIARRRSKSDNDEERRWLGDAADLMLVALRDGEVSDRAIDDVAPTLSIDDGDDAAVDYGAMLRMALGDLGVLVGDDEDVRPIFDGPDDESEDRYSAELADAMAFLRNCLDRREDPLYQYLHALSRIKVPSKDEAAAIVAAMESGMFSAMSAVAASKPAMEMIMEVADQVESGETPWARIFSDDQADAADIDQEALIDEDNDDEADGDDDLGPRLPPGLATRLNAVRDGYSRLRKMRTGSNELFYAQELGRHLHALGMRPDCVERLRMVIVNREMDEGIRRKFTGGLARIRDARAELFHRNQRLVFWTAKKYRWRGFPLMDLVQEGSLGLLKAVDRFDPTKGAKFSTYAIWWIRQSITRAISDQQRTIRIPVHVGEFINKVRRAQSQFEILRGRPPLPEELSAELGSRQEKVALAFTLLQDVVSIDDLDGSGIPLSVGLADSSVCTDEIVLENEIKAIIRRELEGLKHRERLVLSRRFGIGGEGEQTLEELGQQFGVTRERIRQIEAKALTQLWYRPKLRKLRKSLGIKATEVVAPS